MNKISYILGALVFILSVNNSYAETVVSTIYANYPISGRNIHEIRQAILVSGMKDGHGNIFAAKTNAKFTWKYNFVKTTYGCSIKSTDITVEITYQLPEISNYEGLNDADKAEWARYSNATYQHEQGHANIAIETAKEIEWEAKNIVPKSSCGELARTANMLISNILNRHEHNNIAYDTQTAHGTVQGATLLAKK